MNIFVFWIGAFWYAILRHIENSPECIGLYATDNDEFTINFLKKFRRHPYFYEGVKLGDKAIFTMNYKDIVPSIDLIIIATPSQKVLELVRGLKSQLKPGVTLLNLAKWINNETLKTISEWIANELGDFKYNYWVLSWGMIAKEVIEEAQLWVDIGIQNKKIWEKLKRLFEHKNMQIHLVHRWIKNIELYGALKNVCAIAMGYYEGKWYGSSTLGYYLCNILKEIKEIIIILGGDKNFEFLDYSLWGDIIATCFWDSRNRYFGKLVWSGKSVEEALSILVQEKKRAEWYETMKWLKKLLDKKEDKFPIIQYLLQIIIK